MLWLLDFLQSINSILFNALWFCLGALVGHWLAIGRDKRQELNALLKPIRAELLNGQSFQIPLVRLPNDVELDQLERYLSCWKRFWLRRRISQCQQIIREQMVLNTYGEESFRDPEKIRACVTKLLKVLRPL